MILIRIDRGFERGHQDASPSIEDAMLSTAGC